MAPPTPKDPVSSLSAAPVAKILKTMAEVDQAYRRGETRLSPVLTLGFASGASLRGWLLDVGGEPGGGALLQLVEDNGQRSEAVAYFDPAQVASVIVSDARSVAASLAGGRIDPLDGREAPGKLELQRQIKDLEGRLSAALGAAFAVDLAWTSFDTAVPRQMAAAAEILQLAGDVLLKLAADSFARAEVTAKVSSLAISNTTPRAARLDGRILRLCVPFTEGVAGRFDAASLGATLNKMLA